MMKEEALKRSYCGNCVYHYAYDYPEQVFCEYRFLNNQNPFVFTLWCCEYWSPAYQECFCISAALNKVQKE